MAQPGNFRVRTIQYPLQKQIQNALVKKYLKSTSSSPMKKNVAKTFVTENSRGEYLKLVFVRASTSFRVLIHKKPVQTGFL